MEQIHAITHNGLPRSQGGKLICYQVGQTQIFPGFPSLVIQAPPVVSPLTMKARLKAARRANLPDYDKLPRARGYFNYECGYDKCGGDTKLNDAEFRQGWRFIRECLECGKYSRRHEG